MKHYAGDRTIDGVKVTVDGAPLDPRVNFMEFSKNGFEWSYEGPEPRQLARGLANQSVVAHAVGSRLVSVADAYFPDQWTKRRSISRNMRLSP